MCLLLSFLVLVLLLAHVERFFVSRVQNSIIHQTYRSFITKPPRFFRAADTVTSGGQVTGDRWQVTVDRWHVQVTYDRWQKTGGRWQVTGDRKENMCRLRDALFCVCRIFLLCFSSSSLSYKFKIRTNFNTFQTSFLIFFIKLGIVLIFTSTFSIIPQLNKIFHSQELVFQLLSSASHFNNYLIWFPRRVALTFGIQ